MKKTISIFMVMVFGMSAFCAQAQDFVQYVNTMQGTHNTYERSHGRCKPMVGLPHSMHMWNPTESGFRCEDVVFHFVGADRTAEGVLRTSETGRPHSFTATYNNGFAAEATATEHCGLFRITFPKNGCVLFNGTAGSANVSPDKKSLRYKAGNSNVLVKFSRPAKETGECSQGVYVSFAKGSTVEAVVSFSEISERQAEVSLDREVAGRTFAQIKAGLHDVWNKVLGRIEIEGGTPEQRKTFYSCLWRANIFPKKVSEIDENGASRFYYDGKVYEGYNHIHETFWDVAKCQQPLMNILNVEGQKEYMLSLQNSYFLSGWLPNGMIGNHAISAFADAWAKGIRTFDPDKVFEAYWHEATNSELDDSNGYFIEHERGHGRFGHKEYFEMGYIPTGFPIVKVQERTSRTMEYAFDDYCGWRLAKMTGRQVYETAFGRQMYNYKNVIDPADHFPKGRNAKGEWDPDFNPYEWGGPFVEGNAWHYKWCVNHDVQGMIDFLGGEDVFLKEMDEMLTAKCDSIMPGTYGEVIHEINEVVDGGMGQYAPGNEPTFHVLYLYSFAREPWKTQKYLRYSLSHHFNSGPDAFPGDDDWGAMSSFFVFSSMGFYPVTPGVPQYVLGSPLFTKVTIHHPDGKDFVISAENNNERNVYIKDAVLNGEKYTHNWISHEDVMNGGVLELTMSSVPERTRGVLDEDKPYSASRDN